MAKVDESIGFYRKMSELQERLRRSEEERLRLEEKFSLLMRSCRDEEEERLNNLRERYEAFLEEEKRRLERNDRILQALDRIESRTAILTAKSQRLKLLRRHYEAYMLKMYPNWRDVSNKFTGDQPPTRKYDPLLNKLNIEVDRNNPYRGQSSSLSVFPEDYGRIADPTLHQRYSAVAVIPASYQPVSAQSTTVGTAPTTKPIDGLPSPTAAYHTINVVDTENIPSVVVTVGDHSASQKALPVYTHETFIHNQNSATDRVTSNKIEQLDDYLKRAAEMLQLCRGEDNLRDTGKCFSEMNPDSLKDTKNLGNSVDFELEQNTSGDLLNVSLSDDGVLQEETSRTLVEQKGVEDKDISQLEKVNISAVNNKDKLMNKNSQLSENVVDKEGILSNKEIQDLHQGSKPPLLEEENQESDKGGSGDAQMFTSALDGKCEFDKQQQLRQNNSTLRGAGDSVISDKSLCPDEGISETEVQGGLSQREQQYSTLNEEAQNNDKMPNVKRKIEDVERNVSDSTGNAYISVADACEAPVNESGYRAEGGQLSQQYEAEQSGGTEFTDQKQWEENDQQYYQPYPEQQEGDQYYQYGDDMYQQHADGEYGQKYDELYTNQEGEQYYQQYAEQVEGQYGYQNGKQYSEQFVDKESQLYSQQEAQYDQQYGDQQEGQYEDQYMEQHAEQYDQHYEDYQQQGQQNSEPLSEEQWVREGRPSVQCEEANERANNKEDTEEHHDHISEELLQEQQLEVQEESAGGNHERHSYEDEKYQDEMKVCGATEGDVGEKNSEGGMSGAEEVKMLSTVVEDKAYDSTALPKHSDVSSDLTEPSSSGNVKQYRHLLGETGDPEQSDMDELELQLAALVESQAGKDCGKQAQQSMPLGVKMAEQPSSAAENDYDSTLSAESHKNMGKANRTDIKIAETIGHGATVYDNPEAQSSIPQKSSKPENEPVVIPKAGDTVKIIQPPVPRPGSRKLPGLTKMLESDTESLQLDATVSNEDSDDFDFSSDK